ncbi:hypothetical protein C8R46DRAFT_603930 [Mycena filopes]|nr:hypothetical protein C8R46DRAFT_603930 [Mycena filopes]
MLVKHSDDDHSVPFLHGSTSLSEQTTFNDDEKLLNSNGGGEARWRPPRRFNLAAFLQKLVGWPALVIAGQAALQLAAWSFFIIVRRRGSIPLDYDAAAWVQDHAHTITIIFTQISTILAATSSFLFSFGVRQSIALHMHGDGMTLGSFVSTIKIASRGLLLDPRKRRWSSMSIVVVFLTGLQTSGWASLLTPLAISIDTPLTGYELDLTNPKLAALDTEDLRACVVESTLLRSFGVGQSESGYASANAYLGRPATISLMDTSFFVSNGATGGVLPMRMVNLPARTWFPDIPVIPSTLNATQDLPRGLSYNSTVYQQGFTAAVSCRPNNLTNATTPSMLFQNGAVKDSNLKWTRISSTCSADPLYERLNTTAAYSDTGANESNYLLMFACGSSVGSYDLIFLGDGLYSPMSAVCTVTPQIINATVVYNTLTTVTPYYDTAVPEKGPAGISAVTTMYNLMALSQATMANIVADQLSALVEGQTGGNYSDVNGSLRMMELYIQGVVEYSGSVFRACVSGTNSTFLNGPPMEFTTPVHGHRFTQTMGWKHADTSTLLGLIPGTLVALLTIYVVVVAVAHHAEDAVGQPFDPLDARHLVAASAAGGLSNVFKGTEDRDIRVAEGVNVFLEALPGRPPILLATK